MKKIKFISILLAGMIITIDSVRAGAEGKKEVEIRYKVGKYENKSMFNKFMAIDENDTSFNKTSIKELRGKINAQQATIDELDEIKTIELKGTVKELIAKIEANIDKRYQVLAVQRQSSCTILLDQKLDLSNCSFFDNECLDIYLELKSDGNSFLTPEIGLGGLKYPRIYSFCVTTILIFFIGAFCLYHNLSALKGEVLKRKSSWKHRWKAINAMRLSRMLFFFLGIIVVIFWGFGFSYLARFGGYYFYLNNLIFCLLFLFLINLRCNDAKLSKWWLVFFAVPIIYAYIVGILPFNPPQIISQIIAVIIIIDLLEFLDILTSPSIPDEKKKAMKEEEEKEKEEDDAFINSTTDIAN